MRAVGETNVIAQQCCLRFNGSKQQQPWCIEPNSTLMAVPTSSQLSLSVASLAVSMTIMPAKSACHCALISDEPVVLLDI